MKRLEMFYDELEIDLPLLENYYQKGDINSIKNFAHKYRMRLSYFDFGLALKHCKALDSEAIYSASHDLESLVNGLLFELNNIKIQKSI